MAVSAPASRASRTIKLTAQAFFAMPVFDFTTSSAPSVQQPAFRIYWAITIPLTFCVLCAYLAYSVWAHRKFHQVSRSAQKSSAIQRSTQQDSGPARRPIRTTLDAVAMSIDANNSSESGSRERTKVPPNRRGLGSGRPDEEIAPTGISSAHLAEARGLRRKKSQLRYSKRRSPGVFLISRHHAEIGTCDCGHFHLCKQLYSC
jgi:hypothetical protein